MSIKPCTELTVKIIIWTVFWTLLLSLSAPLFAGTFNGTGEQNQVSRSISFIKNTSPDKITRKAQLDAARTTLNTTGNFRSRIESTSLAISATSVDYSHYGEISIYETLTELISDLNGDGFYHRFSITVDADTIFAVSYIYARLYLSYEGGPWQHYATSDNYHIYGNSDTDTFVIETELADGFAPGYYDVRIELYDADNDSWLLSYGPYDDPSLNALPLEDSYSDETQLVILPPVETEIVVAAHTGSMSAWLIFIPVMVAVGRKASGPSNKVFSNNTVTDKIKNL